MFYSRFFWLLSRNWIAEGQSESWEATAVPAAGQGHDDIDQDIGNRYGEKSTSSVY